MAETIWYCSCLGMVAILIGQAATVLADASCPADAVVTQDTPHIRMISRHPRVFILEKFFSESEVEHLREVAAELGVFEKAKPNPDNSQDESDYHQEFVPDNLHEFDKILANLDDRIAAFTHIPQEIEASGGISLSVRNATSSHGITNLHHDHNAAAGAVHELVKQQGRDIPLTELYGTLLGYLSDVDAGGETVFPCICDRKQNGCSKVQKSCKYLYERGVLHVHPRGHGTFKELDSQARKRVKKHVDMLVNASQQMCIDRSIPGVRIIPRRGHALLFFSNSVRGIADPRTWHGSCKVISGQKFNMQRFLYAPQSELETGPDATAVFKW